MDPCRQHEHEKGYMKMKQYVKHALMEHLNKSFGQVTVNIKQLEQLKGHLDSVVRAQSTVKSNANLTWTWK